MSASGHLRHQNRPFGRIAAMHPAEETRPMYENGIHCSNGKTMYLREFLRKRLYKLFDHEGITSHSSASCMLDSSVSRGCLTRDRGFIHEKLASALHFVNIFTIQNGWAAKNHVHKHDKVITFRYQRRARRENHRSQTPSGAD